MLPWHPPLSTTSEEAAAHYLEGLHRHLSILPAAGRSFHNAFELDPEFGVGAAALAVAATGVGELDLARRALAAARRAAATAPAMSRSHIGAVDALLTQPRGPALASAHRHLSDYPTDLLVLAMTLSSLHGSGSRTRRQQAAALLDRAGGTGHFAVPSLRSVIAADLGELARARADAITGLELNPRSAHAAHGLAHVHYETQDHEEGRAWLSAWTSDFDLRGSGVHLAWHLALHDLALGDLDGLLQRYDVTMRPSLTVAQYVDTVDILWRMQLAGIDVDERFASLREVVPLVPEVRGTSLSVLQSVVVLAGARDRVALASAVASLRTSTEPSVRDAVLDVAKGLLAWVEGDAAQAVEHLEAVDGALVAVAASNVQLDLVSNTLLRCYEQAGRTPDPEAFLVARLQNGSDRATG